MKHQLTYTDPNTQEISRVDEYLGGNPPIRKNGGLPEINEGLKAGYAYVPIIPRSAVSYDPDTHKLVKMAQPTAQEDGWDVVLLTQEEIDARNFVPVRKADRVSFEIAMLETLGITLTDVSGFIDAMPEVTPEEVFAKKVARIRFDGSAKMKETDDLLIAIASNMVEAGLVPHDTEAEDISAAKQAAVAETVDAIFTRAAEINIELQ